MFVSPIGYLFFILHVFSNMQGVKKGAEALGSDMNFRKAHGTVNIQYIIPIQLSRRVTLVSEGSRLVSECLFARLFS